jgi:hypothetical protein
MKYDKSEFNKGFCNNNACNVCTPLPRNGIFANNSNIKKMISQNGAMVEPNSAIDLLKNFNISSNRNLEGFVWSSQAHKGKTCYIIEILNMKYGKEMSKVDHAILKFNGNSPQIVWNFSDPRYSLVFY